MTEEQFKAACCDRCKDLRSPLHYNCSCHTPTHQNEAEWAEWFDFVQEADRALVVKLVADHFISKAQIAEVVTEMMFKDAATAPEDGWNTALEAVREKLITNNKEHD